MTPRRALVEGLGGFAAATLAAAILYRVGGAVPWIASNLHALVAIVFLYVPVAIGWKRREGLEAEGLTHRPLGKSLMIAGAYVAIVLPLFAIGFVELQKLACAHGHWKLLEIVTPPARCRWLVGWEGLAHPKFPPDLAQTVLGQLFVVALPEELFFRGFLLRRLEVAFPPRHRVGGGGVGLALLVSALLFALGHVLVDFDPKRFAVFFPALLFGWMRSATGSVLAGALAHASSNLYIETLGRTFFR